MVLDPVIEYHSRNLYDLNELLSDLGGVTRVLIAIFGVFLYPLSEFNYIRAMSRRLYYVSTKDEKLFGKKNTEGKLDQQNCLIKWNKQDKIPPFYNHEMKNEIRQHRISFMSLLDEMFLFVHQAFDSLFCKVKFCKIFGEKKRVKLLKFYKESRHRIQKELNVIKLIHSMSLMKSFLKNSFMNDDIKFSCLHSEKRVIYIDN